MHARDLHQRLLLLTACLVLDTGAGHAQTFDATQLAGPASLSMPLLLHAGVDETWIRPDLNDSNWLIIDPTPPRLIP
jgi:hypothetical protein